VRKPRATTFFGNESEEKINNANAEIKLAEGGSPGVVDSFILDKFGDPEHAAFSFKHRYLLFALDNGILLDLPAAIRLYRKVELEFDAGRHTELI